ncbi:glycolipid 2-alpha-mannosyltransferase-domain-containing protein, partial [Mycena rosella]
VVVSGHYILSLTHEAYARATSFSRLVSRPATAIPALASRPRANATFVILACNSDLDSTVRSVCEVEDRFNTRHHYPYTLLNDEPFTDEFKRRVSAVASGPVAYGLVPREHRVQPDCIDEERATKGREQLVADNVIYGGSVNYRNMCRYNSGFFFRHLLVEQYRWYWRIEPDVHFHCDVSYDPFWHMQDRGKVYGFTIPMYELEKTIPTLWGHVKDFIKLHPEHIALGFVSDNGGDVSLCVRLRIPLTRYLLYVPARSACVQIQTRIRRTPPHAARAGRPAYARALCVRGSRWACADALAREAPSSPLVRGAAKTQPECGTRPAVPAPPALSKRPARVGRRLDK